MITNINISSELKERLEQHLQKGESYEDVIIKLLDLDDEYGSSDVEFEAVFDDEIIKVFRLNNNQIEYFTPIRKFSISLSDWNLDSKYSKDWIRFITSPDVMKVLVSLDENILECGCFKIRQLN